MTAAPYEPAEGEIWRTARREHTCHGCQRPIPRGERYIEYIGEVAAYQSGSRWHVECARAANRRSEEWARTMRHR